ncbi:MAG: hypothetical protein AAFN78_05680 [Pseudomonadota bacterium]
MTDNRTDNKPHVDEQVGELLTGYIDGELTQQQRQRVEMLCESSEEAAQLLEELKALRSQLGAAPLTPYGEDKWRESMDDTTVRVSRGIGWLLLGGGALLLAGMVVAALFMDPEIGGWERAALLLIYGGGAALFGSVLRQRLIERKTDKYKDVEI